MSRFKITNPDGTFDEVSFNGTIQQFVMKQWRYGVPHGHRVFEVAVVAPEVVQEVEHEPKPVVVPKSRTRRGESK